MDTFQKNIRDTLVNSPSSVHAIFYGPKSINELVTDEFSLVYFVEKKLPPNEVPNDQLIPSEINIDGTEYKTDVLQYKKFVLNQCYTLTDAQVVYLQTKHRPLSGGIEISNLASWEQALPYVFDYRVGTLGFLAIDNDDNKLVGVTNAHVIVNDSSISSDRNPLSATSSIIDNIQFDTTSGLIASYKPSVLQFKSVDGVVNFTTDSIGCPKRYVPIFENAYNSVDGALIALNAGTADSSSAQQALLANSYAMQFATTSEIQSLSSTSIPIYSVGRSTGPKGVNCPLTVFGFGSILIDFYRQKSPVSIVMSDLIIYKYQDSSNLPIYLGDSGSAVVGDFGGTLKIIGLAFGGDNNLDTYHPTSTFAVASRIDNVADQLNISSWDGTSFNFSDTDVKNVSKIYRPLSDNRPVIMYNGKRYYQAGTVNTSATITNA